MARGIELDWVVVRVNTLRKTAAVAVLGLVAAAAVIFAYTRLNLPPEARARRAIERAEAARLVAAEQPMPDNWRSELQDASRQLEGARAAYIDENWSSSEDLAAAARRRFEALVGPALDELVGAGTVFSLDGRVQIQRAGKGAWESATLGMALFNGDFVKSGRDGSAEILFSDATLYRIGPNSILEIHQRDESNDRGGAVNMVVGRINVFTSDSRSMVTTDATETRIERDSQVAVDVGDRDTGRTTVATLSGAAVVRDSQGRSVRLGSREVVAAAAETGLGEKAKLPEAPVQTSPMNNAAYDLDRDSVIRLRWRRPDETAAVHLQVSRNKRFLEDELDVDAPTLSQNGARLRPVSPGTYFWRVATVSNQSVRSNWSSVRRFRIFSATKRPLLEDHTPPELEVKSPQQLGHLFIVEGRTEPGASVSINGESVEPDGDGTFSKAVEFREDGWNDLVVIAVDPSGNPSEHRERVYVEVF